MPSAKSFLAFSLAVHCTVVTASDFLAHETPRTLFSHSPKHSARFDKPDGCRRGRLQATAPAEGGLDAALSLPRGGDLGSVSSPVLAKTFCALAGLDALTFSFFSRPLLSLTGTDVEEGSFTDRILRDVGAHAASAAVGVYFSVVAGASAEHALGYAYLPRLAVSLSNLLTGATKNRGASAAACASLCLTVFALLGDEWRPLWFAKGAALVFLVQGVTCRLNPATLDRAEYADLGYAMEDELTAATVSFAADYQIMCHFMLLLLAEGFDPVKATGYASLGAVTLLLDFACGFKMHKVLGFSVAWVLLATIFCGALGVGILT